MNEQLFINKFVEQLEGYQGEPLTMDSEFRQIDVWDSLTGVAVQIMISDDFNASIPDGKFVEAKTVGDIYNLAKKYHKE
ncbi:hypothetical protein BN938_2717 [Mucinivorans hirudinis]|uniref:Carrier domain-containing protein n=1 Tax=Mucinivorans hirudinis TaxID=1433126 RepID=A0A060RAW8_9BACT|nr:hypothetical protein BN938_2717 [Mucinivorans hirudinis]